MQNVNLNLNKIDKFDVTYENMKLHAREKTVARLKQNGKVVNISFVNGYDERQKAYGQLIMNLTETSSSQEVAEKIREIVIRKRSSYSAVAAELGFSQPYVSQIARLYEIDRKSTNV